MQKSEITVKRTHTATTLLAIQRLENISKIESYYLTNIKAELLYYDKTSTSNELINLANDSPIGALMSLESENDYLNNVNLNDNSIQTRNTLIIEDIIGFNFFNNNSEVNENETNIDNSYNLDYDPELLNKKLSFKSFEKKFCVNYFHTAYWHNVWHMAQ
ncbi:17408_t:CDS:2, partial [Entrophospora sp. SA101]